MVFSPRSFLTPVSLSVSGPGSLGSLSVVLVSDRRPGVGVSVRQLGNF